METFNINIGGKSYELKYTTRAICSLEKQLGYSVLSSEFLELKGIEKALVMLWAGLLPNHNMTLDDVYLLFDDLPGSEILSCIPVINKAFNYFWGIGEEVTTQPKPQEKKTKKR